ncbi:hypothetical protein GMD78_17225 [Ornithinibacillus sp. L9]|uniref:Lipoprotein n=1 Tax=Ornithinibacillus caprae TaxID=2678566 RepID=A0A6N8FPN2_9BACI|nr:hypothetical protein [Ornithinibacillus caprae]MUK90117.1 hypothetical protein [Ornithinibacillus caprae]
MKSIIWKMNKKIILLIPILFIATGCSDVFQLSPSEKVKSYGENYEIIGNEKEELLQDVSETIFEHGDRSNSQAQEHHIPALDVRETFSVPEGRYQITGNITGNVYIHDDKGVLVYHNIVGSPYGVPAITLDIKDTYTITVDGFDQVAVIPIETQIQTELTAGIWEVGMDIEAGDYIITGPHGGIGYVQILDTNDEAKVYEVFGGDFSSSNSHIQLKEGQIIRIIGISTVYFRAE